MELTYYGHSTFLLAADGTTILIDPFNPDCGYTLPDIAPTAVAVSHEHFDHSYVQVAKGDPTVIRGLVDEGKNWAKIDERVGPVRLTTVPTYHDGSQGKERGRNAMFVFEAEDLRVVHSGDLGHQLDAEQVRAVGRPDVLMIPIGGFYTIGPADADKVIAAVKPRLVIPMHYKTEATRGWPIGSLDDFTRGKTQVVEQKQKVSVSRAALPAHGSIWVLAHRS